MAAPAEHLSPTEAARRLGVTVKALKLYERKGLVRPMRTGAGWRVYGPEQVLRLHEVLALKAMGLPLAEIGALLAGRATDLDRTLALQAAALSERRGEIDRALARIGQVRAALAAGAAPSTAEVLALARETAAGTAHWGGRIAEHYRRHLGDDGLARLRPGDPALWTALLEELKTLRTDGADPRAPAAQDFFRRWIAASEAVSGADPRLNAQAYSAWMEALDDPQTAPALPIGKAEVDYLARLGAAAAS
jgi:DNA-binding transcriptional MerR regulator